MKQTSKAQRKALKSVKRFYKAITSNATKRVARYEYSEQMTERRRNKVGILFGGNVHVATDFSVFCTATPGTVYMRCEAVKANKASNTIVFA